MALEDNTKDASVVGDEALLASVRGDASHGAAEPGEGAPEPVERSDVRPVAEARPFARGLRGGSADLLSVGVNGGTPTPLPVGQSTIGHRLGRPVSTLSLFFIQPSAFRSDTQGEIYICLNPT